MILVLLALAFVFTLVSFTFAVRTTRRNAPVEAKPASRAGFVPAKGHKASDGFPRGTWTL